MHGYKQTVSEDAMNQKSTRGHILVQDHNAKHVESWML